jgi:hypothetical protein
MAINDPDMHRTGVRPGSMGRHDPRNSGNYTPYIIGGVVVLAVLFVFLGDSISSRTTLPPETTVPQTTTTPAPTAPATK